MGIIGKRRDGYANRELDPGKIIALSPALTADQKARASPIFFKEYL